MSALTLIKRHENCVLHAYKDSRGVWTAGWGTNLQVLVIDQATADNWRDQKMSANLRKLQRIGAFVALDPVRQDALQDMAYQMGVSGLLGFHNMWDALAIKDWQIAHDEALDSPWAKKETPARAKEIAQILLTGIASS